MSPEWDESLTAVESHPREPGHTGQHVPHHLDPIWVLGPVFTGQSLIA